MAEQQIMTNPPLAGAPMDGARAGSTGNPFANLFNFADVLHQPAVQRAMPAIGLGGAVLLAGAAWWALQSPTMAPVYSGLSEVDKSAVAASLDSAGIEYKLNNATGAIEVSEDEVRRARMLLAGEGLPKAAPEADAILANLPMGASRGLEGQALRAAREADIARTVEAMDAVQTARVHLALPEPSAFVRDTAPAAASVMLSLYKGRSLSAEQINSIRYLVASSVPKLQPDNVSIVDQNGSLLTDKAQSAASETLNLQMTLEDRYREAIAQMLTPIVGAANFSSEVHVELDPTESQSTRERFPEEDRVLSSEQGNTRTMPSDDGAGGGIPGALANQPPPASQLMNTDPGVDQASAATNGPVEETYSRNYDLGREISVTHTPQGGVERISVAVALRKDGENELSQTEVKKIEQLVRSAVGFREDRGDMVTVTAASFVTPQAAEVPMWNQPWFMPVARQAGAVLVAILMLFFIVLPAFRRFREARANRNDRLMTALAAAKSMPRMPPVEGGPSLPDYSQASPEITLEMIEAAPTNEMKTELVRHFVRQDPTRAAQVVRELMQD